MTVVFSRRDQVQWTAPGTERVYTLAPLTFRERQAFRADMAREAGLYPSRPQLIEAMRVAITDLAPANTAELLVDIEAGTAVPDDPKDHTSEDQAAVARLATIEAICAAAPGYAELLAARQRYIGMLPWVAARHALRGWEGPSLPPFWRERGLVPADLLDLLPDDEVQGIGLLASDLMQPDARALGNSAPPSSSPATPAPSTVG